MQKKNSFISLFIGSILACGFGAIALFSLNLLPLQFIQGPIESGGSAQVRLALAIGGSVAPNDIDPDSAPFNSERVTFALDGVTTPPNDRVLNGYLLDGELLDGVLCSTLPVENGIVSASYDFPGRNLIGSYDTVRLMQETEVLSTTVPIEALGYLRQLLSAADGTPSQVGYGVGLKKQAALLASHAGFARDAAAAGNLSSAKRHTEHVLNILYGAADARYGDHDNDGVPTNPGDGYGLLVYRTKVDEAMGQAAASTDTTANIQTRAAEVQVALGNMGSGEDGEWIDLFIARAEALLVATTATDAETFANQLVGLAERIATGEDLDDSGTIDPIADEGGALIAYRHAQYAAEFTTSAGYVRYADSSSGASDQLRINLSGLTAPNAGERYWAYLLQADGQRTMLGAVDGPGGLIDETIPGPGHNLVANHSGVLITVGQALGEDQLPTEALGYVRTLLYKASGTPSEKGYGTGLKEQARLLARHARFAQDAAQAGNMSGAKQHTEHVLNILYGQTDPRYGDLDGDSVASNPGDKFGVLPYRMQTGDILNQALLSADISTAMAGYLQQVQTTLENIGNGEDDKWAKLLIDRATDLLAASNIADLQSSANQMLGIADRIYNGEDLNDSGAVEPIEGEGGALVAYRTMQKAANYSPKPVENTDPTTTPTATPMSTATPMPTATATLVSGAPTLTPTSTIAPSGNGDGYEDDNECSVAREISTDGLIQNRTFHTSSDSDWVRFAADSGEAYIIEVTIPEGSPADVAAEFYPACGATATDAQDFQFAPGVRMDFTAPQTGSYYLRFFNSKSNGGSDVRYDLTIRSLQSSEASPGLLILVAGQIKNNDPVQPNIYHVTDEVRQLFIDKGATDEQIYYIAPDLSRTGVDAAATQANLEAAITQWADEQAADAQSITIYLMDHGGDDIFYLDKLRGEWITPDQLDGWLDKLEALRPTLNINIIYEACESGSFVSGDKSISKPGRVVMTSTDDVNLAWASDDGAIFSDHLLDSLRRGESLYTSFQNARIAAQIAHPNQAPWIDADGDGNGTDDASQTVAAQRGFAFAGTFPDEIWPPFIAEVQEVVPDEQGRAVLRTQVRDDVDVESVWAVIYPPSYIAPTEGEELVQEVLPTTVLLDQGNDWYGARFDGFRESGTYRVVFFADDNQDVDARPFSVTVQVGSDDVYLPIVMK